MDTMRCAASDWLELAREAAASIEELTREISALEDARDECTTWQATGGGAGSRDVHSDPTAAQAMARIAQLDALIADKRAAWERAVQLVGACGEVLERMGHELGVRHRMALELYYLDRAETWSEVADELGCERTTVWRMRKESYAWIERNCPNLLA